MSEIIQEEEFTLKPHKQQDYGDGLMPSAWGPAVGEYQVSFDHKGRIKAQFVIPRNKKAWAIIDFLQRKLEAKYAGCEILSIKRHTYRAGVDNIEWLVKWYIPGMAINRKVEL